MRVLLRRFVSVTVAVGLGIASPVVLAAPGENADAPVETEPPAQTDPDQPPLDTDELPLDTDEPPLDTDERPLDTDEPEPEGLDTDDALAPDPELDDETLDRDADDDGFDDDYQVLRDSPEAKTARRWLAAGIAATATGAVLVGGAIAMSQTAPCDVEAGNNCFSDARDRAAVTLGAPGGVLLLGGIAMTIVGALQRRSLWHDLAFAPAPNGLIVTGRF
jgi:hypothetical protein